MAEFEPQIVAFCCNWCTYAAADLAGTSRVHYPANVKILRVMCSGMVRRLSARKFYPGYVLVRMDLTDDSWHLVKDTPKVTGFVGSKTEPVAIPDEDAEKIISQMQEGIAKPKPKIQFEIGDKVQVTDGPFTNFTGSVDEVRADKGKVKVMISVFGRPTPVELEFTQLEKI